ncbi:MAG TPA: DUF4349 domain-containing protein [Pyrinomonadaceae bacterium]|nr:DUF4349 domain-containing protein [Pyrinomonadaceae bacterium]
MRLFLTSLLIMAALVCAACSSQRPDTAQSTGPGSTSTSQAGGQSGAMAPSERATTASSDAKSSAGMDQEHATNYDYQKVSEKQPSIPQTDAERAAAIAAGRKIISNATLNLELSDPADGQRKTARIAIAHGGFVVNSDVSHRDNEDQTKPELTVNITVRVPADQFDAAVEEIKGLASRVRQDKVTGQDVTEEFYDLEARIKAKRALEAQFMEIMKQAHTVADALQVQTQLAEVRTEIERLEGRRRYLENQSSLSTINVTMSTPALLVNTNSTGFFHQVKRAFGSGVDIGAGITLFIIEAVLALLPVALLIFLPLGLLIRYVVRRNRRLQLARSLVQDEDQPVPQAR